MTHVQNVIELFAADPYVENGDYSRLIEDADERDRADEANGELSDWRDEAPAGCWPMRLDGDDVRHVEAEAGAWRELRGWLFEAFAPLALELGIDAPARDRL